MIFVLSGWLPLPCLGRDRNHLWWIKLSLKFLFVNCYVPKKWNLGTHVSFSFSLSLSVCLSVCLSCSVIVKSECHGHADWVHQRSAPESTCPEMINPVQLSGLYSPVNNDLTNQKSHVLRWSTLCSCQDFTVQSIMIWLTKNHMSWDDWPCAVVRTLQSSQ